MRPSPLERFHTHYNVTPSGCWEWSKALNHGGYGTFAYGGRRMGAHRAAWELLRGPIPAGLDVDHLCRNRRCVNPDHLEPVTRSVNLARGQVGGWNRDITRCRQGHPFSPDNTYTDPRGWRGCRECRSAAKVRYLERKAAA
jgi:hypothetical protein